MQNSLLESAVTHHSYMSRKALIKESILYAAGNILQKLGDFVFIPIFTYYLTIEEYGDLSLYLSVIPLLLLLLQQGTRTGFLALYYEYEGSKRKELYTTVLIYNIIASAVVIFIIFICRGTLSNLISARLAFFPIGVLILAIGFTNNLFQLNLVYFQVKHKAGFYVIYSLLCFFGRYGLIVALIVVQKMGLNGYLLGYFLANTVLVLLPNLIYLIKVGFRFSTAYLFPLLTFSLPLVPHLIASWVYNLSSRVIVARYVSTEDYAVFSLGANVALAFSVIVSSFALAWGPHYLRTATQSDQARTTLRNDTILSLRLFSLLFVGFLLFSPELVTIAGRKSLYKSAYEVVPFILLGYFFLLMHILMIASFYLKKKTFLLSLISVPAGIFSILSLVYFSKYHGIMGASVAMAVNYCVLFLVIGYFSNRISPIPVSKALFLMAAITTVMTFMLGYLNEVVGITFFSFILKTCIFLILGYLISRKEIHLAISVLKGQQARY